MTGITGGVVQRPNASMACGRPQFDFHAGPDVPLGNGGRRAQLVHLLPARRRETASTNSSTRMMPNGGRRRDRGAQSRQQEEDDQAGHASAARGTGWPSESPAWAAATASRSIARATGMLLEEDPRTHASRRNSSAAVQPATGTKSASSSSSTHVPSDSCRATCAACALRSAWTASKASRARPQARS